MHKDIDAFESKQIQLFETFIHDLKYKNPSSRTFVVSMHNVQKIQLFDRETKEEGRGFIIVRYNRSSQVALASHPQNATPHPQEVTFSFLSRPGSAVTQVIFFHILPHKPPGFFSSFVQAPYLPLSPNTPTS